MGCLLDLCKKKKHHQSLDIPSYIHDEGKELEKKSGTASDKFSLSVVNGFQVSNNWDGYFTEDQINYYKSLYENESFDTSSSTATFISHGNIRKGELIGEGSYGKVYQAFNEENGNIIAIKEINISKLSKYSINITNSVQNEIEVLSKLNHKNIIKYLGSYVKGYKLNLVLEYCIGGSLYKLLEVYRNFKETIIRKYTVQILEGIEYLHSHNIMHRDIKCANILINRDGVCKLSDFGGAKIIKDIFDITKSSIEGTPNWMAPEIVKKAEATRFSDIWSIGCTVIEMFQGKPPWSNYYTAISVMNCIYNTKEPPEIPAQASDELRDFLEHCLQLEPKKRWNVYQLLRHPFITKKKFFNFDNIGEDKPLIDKGYYYDKEKIYAQEMEKYKNDNSERNKENKL